MPLTEQTIAEKDDRRLTALNILKELKARGFSKWVISHRSKVRWNTLRNWETGLSRTSPINLAKLQTFFLEVINAEQRKKSRRNAPAKSKVKKARRKRKAA